MPIAKTLGLICLISIQMSYHGTSTWYFPLQKQKQYMKKTHNSCSKLFFVQSFSSLFWHYKGKFCTVIHVAPLSLPLLVRHSHCISWIIYLPYILLLIPLTLHLVSPRKFLHLPVKRSSHDLTWFLRILKSVFGISNYLWFSVTLHLFAYTYDDR